MEAGALEKFEVSGAEDWQQRSLYRGVVIAIERARQGRE